MCGICGKLNFAKGAGVSPTSDSGNDGQRFAIEGRTTKGSISHPKWGLGSARLSIIDLNSGHQPLSNEDGTVWIVFNGEIYNYQELRDIPLEQGSLF